MLSIGGITYTDAWNAALAAERHPARAERGRGGDAARRRHRDRLRGEHRPRPRRACRRSSRLPLGASLRRHRQQRTRAAHHRPRRRRPLADRPQPQGDRRLAAHGRRRCSTTPTRWCRPPAVDASKAIANWQEHIDGKPQYAPPDPAARAGQVHRRPLRRRGQPARPGVHQLRRLAPEVHAARSSRRSAPNGAGTTAGMLGFMFWAAERPSTRGVGTQPPNTCEGGMGVGATTFDDPDPDASPPNEVAAGLTTDGDRSIRRRASDRLRRPTTSPAGHRTTPASPARRRSRRRASRP